MTEGQRQSYVAKINELRDLIERRKVVLASIEALEKTSEDVKKYLRLCGEKISLGDKMPDYCFDPNYQEALGNGKVGALLPLIGDMRQN